MKIPVVLSTVHVAIGADGDVVVDVDGAPYAVSRHFGRSDVQSVLDQITTELGTAVRVEIRETDGATYADIAVPPDPPAPATEESRPETATPAFAGAGFRPGEEVALAYVVSRQSADPDGNASINLPPALLSAVRGDLVLLGLTSQTIAPLEESG